MYDNIQCVFYILSLFISIIGIFIAYSRKTNLLGIGCAKISIALIITGLICGILKKVVVMNEEMVGIVVSTFWIGIVIGFLLCLGGEY